MLIAGVLLTTVVGALAPLYTTLVAQVGMVQRLTAASDQSVHIHTQVLVSAADTDIEGVWTRLDAAMQSAARDAFDPVNADWLNAVIPWSESAPMFAVQNGADIPALKLRVAAYADWETQAIVKEGGAVAESAVADFAGVLSQEVGRQFGLNVGDVITLDQRGWETSRPFTVEITGIVAAGDPVAPFWMAPSPLRVETRSGTTEANILMRREDVTRILREYVPQARSTIGWRMLFDHSSLSFNRLHQAVDQTEVILAAAEQLVEAEDLSLASATDLPAVLNGYADEVNLLNAPFGVLMLQVGGLALFFLFITSALAQRSERREVAMLQSRGALDGQILLLRTFETLIVCAAAALAAPFLARQALVWLAPLLLEDQRLTLELDALPFLYAGAAGLLALIVLISTLRPVLRLPLITAGGSAVRAARQNWWQRYYLDLLLLIVGSAALFRLLVTDSPFTRSLLGGLRADPLLLIAPALLFVALGSVTLRLFPVLTDAVARFYAARSGLVGTLAAWTVSREPAHYSRIAFLLALAIGVGWFATSFQATLRRSHQDQALYRVGADLRLAGQAAPGLSADTPGIQTIAPALRVPDLNFSLDGNRVLHGTLLAVDGDTFADAAYWREDLGSLTTPQSPDLPQPGAPLPAGTTRLGVWVQLREQVLNEDATAFLDGLPLITELVLGTQVNARFRTADGRVLQVPLVATQVEGRESVDDIDDLFFSVNPFFPEEMVQAERDRLMAALEGVSGWVYYEGDASEADGAALQMISWRTNYDIPPNFPERRTLLVNGLTPRNAEGEVLSGDLLTGDWTVTVDNAAVLEGETAAAETDKGPGWRLALVQRQGNTAFGLTLLPTPPPLPAVVSAPFAAEYALIPGASFVLYIDSRPFTFAVDAIVDYFPTLYAAQAPFAVADLDTLLYTLNRRPAGSAAPNEWFIALDEGVDPRDWLNSWEGAFADAESGSMQVAASAAEALAADVLTIGLSRLLVIAFVIALLLSIISMMVYAALNAQSRRDQFAVLRALGLSSSRIALSVALEQVIVFVVALLLGSVMGMLLSTQVLPSLAISSEGRQITPPFQIEVEVSALLGYATVLLLLLVLVVLASMLLIRRLSLGQALRFQGE
ncbi:MAG: ABC transporter permease [Chloroflexi bacterium]|nr:ABC transporter permease [Chloroflexota bacterium]